MDSNIDPNNMDELSIDSKTNEKVCIKMQPVRKKSISKPQFKIDWRQLTFYQKPDSFLSRWTDKTSNMNKLDENLNLNLNTSKTKPKRILNSLDGCFKSGELSAILGPSGAGKTTFLSTLFGSKQENAFGQTKVTWFSEDNPIDTIQQRSLKIAFLPQKDHLLHHLTVYETLLFASKIKNTDQTSREKNFHRLNVKRVAKMLKLTDCLDTRCGRLSGGQYKRVSIGQELLSKPDVIILDEPTSGLDAITCLSTVQTLKSIVIKHPISIILTIHQPEVDVFNLFDRIYVIAQGGLAIYEGAPQNVVSTLGMVGLEMPYENYNPARFILEHAFIIENDPTEQRKASDPINLFANDFNKTNNLRKEENSCEGADEDDYDDDDGDDDDDDDVDSDNVDTVQEKSNYIRRSVLSLTEAISGKEMASNKKDKRPLLNFGIQTIDGKLITSSNLARNSLTEQQTARMNILRRLNEIQRASYQDKRLDVHSPSDSYFSSSQITGCRSDLMATKDGHRLPVIEWHPSAKLAKDEKSSSKSDYSSSGWSDNRACSSRTSNSIDQSQNKMSKASSLLFINECPSTGYMKATDKTIGKSLPMVNEDRNVQVSMYKSQSPSSSSSSHSEESSFVEKFSNPRDSAISSSINQTSFKGIKLKRQFDKRLSAKHNCSKQTDNPTWRHAFLLTHRTWLSIVRDPIFFGIQAAMHTTIPLLLALIFGSSQEEGCPQVGNFDLVEFAYSDSNNLIEGTVNSIRKSIGNIGIMFFEMFVLCFAINCITALVFPMDMYVLLKEYRNGWYSMKSYFFGRTLADLPVPIVLHSVSMSILYYMTNQPHSLWRYSYTILIVVLASLVAQSFGLTIGAILMRSSQSAVLAAAGIVAPIFALSGFIVRTHTLPLFVQIASGASYLSHLLNGFIILRYGFGRCDCKEEDFHSDNGHQIPSNLHNLASIWIGTYSDEYTNSPVMTALSHKNKTNIDPNIDVVDKMLNAFKMASSYGHKIQTCDDVIPYAMLDFNLRDNDIYCCFISLVIMLLVTRFITFTAIYYKIRSFS